MGRTSGMLAGRFPYTSVGSGSRSLVVLPGVGDAMHPGPHPPGSTVVGRTYFRRLRRDRTVFVVSRPRGLPEDFDIEASAENHVDALEAIRAADGSDDRIELVGVSMGGLIGQELARRRPDLVDALVLANSGCRIDDDARPAIDRLHRYATDRRWADIRAQLAEAMFSDWRSLSYPPLLRTLWRPFLPRPADPADVERSFEAIRSYDGTGGLAGIEPSTLVFGGDRDPYFTPRVLRETADGIPDAELSLVPGAKHAAFHERKRTFDSQVRSFLE